MICGTTIRPDKMSEDQRPSVWVKVCPTSGRMRGVGELKQKEADGKGQQPMVPQESSRD